MSVSELFSWRCQLSALGLAHSLMGWIVGSFELLSVPLQPARGPFVLLQPDLVHSPSVHPVYILYNCSCLLAYLWSTVGTVFTPSNGHWGNLVLKPIRNPELTPIRELRLKPVCQSTSHGTHCQFCYLTTAVTQEQHTQVHAVHTHF